MKAHHPIGLIAAGRLTDSALPQLTAVLHALGPVAAGSRRLASRYANILKAGRPVTGLAELSESRILLIQVARADWCSLGQVLLRQPWDWSGRLIVFLSNDLGSADLEPFAHLGCCTASLWPSPAGGAFFVEGSERAVKVLRRYLEKSRLRAVPLTHSSKQLFLKSLRVLESEFPLLLNKAASGLVRAGLHRREARRLLGPIAEGTLLRFCVHGRRILARPRRITG